MLGTVRNSHVPAELSVAFLRRGACLQAGRLLVSRRVWILTIPARVSLSTTQTLAWFLSAKQQKFILLQNLRGLGVAAEDARCRNENLGFSFPAFASWKLHPSLASLMADGSASQLRSFMYMQRHCWKPISSGGSSVLSYSGHQNSIWLGCFFSL